MYFGERLRSGTGRDERGRERENQALLPGFWFRPMGGWACPSLK